VAVAIPAVFVEFMREVSALIKSGHESTTVEADDILQCDRVYGGLADAQTGRFSFRYFDTREAKWDVDLSTTQITDIASGALRRLSLWRCSRGTCACLYPAEGSYCPHCDSIRHFDGDYPQRLRRLYRDASPDEVASMANLRRIVLAIRDYMTANDDRMPPAFTSDLSGNRLHSWRSLILPFLDLDDLHDAIDFRQPWDAPPNQAVAASMPAAFHSPGTASPGTRYMAILGQKTLWPPNGNRKLSDVTSGYSRTIAVVEAPASQCHWMEPKDIEFDTIAGQVASHDRSLLASWVDGNATALRNLDERRLLELATI
jgi:hypothetical protein